MGDGGRGEGGGGDMINDEGLTLNEVILLRLLRSHLPYLTLYLHRENINE